MNSEVKRVLEALPKVELHVHIEGTLEPELMFSLAAKNGLQLPYASVEEVRKAYNFTNLQSFLDIYYQGASVLCTAEDFFELTKCYFKKGRQQNLKHVEIFFDPQAHLSRGVEFGEIFEGIHAAQIYAQEKYGISSELILCFLRHLTEDQGLQVLNLAEPYREHIIGVGLDSSELGHPPRKFERLFAEAKRRGYLTVAHAGEEGPSDYIWEALRLLSVARIDHGVQCLQDPQLVEHLRLNRIPLTVCPLSNIKLKVFPSMAEHSLKQMLEDGLLVTINSDDPSYFGGYILENMFEVERVFNLGVSGWGLLARNSIAASFASESRKTELQTLVSEVLSTEG